MTKSKGIFFKESVPPEQADCIVLGVPFDGTVSNRPGTRFGPPAIRDATHGVEDYSPYRERDLSEIEIHDAGNIEVPFGDTAKALDAIESAYRELMKYEKPVVCLGGEHLISYPLIRALAEKYNEDIFVIQFDAHADLRSEYLGVELSHASVMHLVNGIVGTGNTAAVGIRSGSKEEWDLVRRHPHYFGGPHGKDLNLFRELIPDLKQRKKVYITVDLDVFDPGIMPGTGTPEPGGIEFRQFVRLLEPLENCDLIGADIVELAPDYDPSGISNALAATVLREILLL